MIMSALIFANRIDSNTQIECKAEDDCVENFQMQSQDWQKWIRMLRVDSRNSIQLDVARGQSHDIK